MKSKLTPECGDAEFETLGLHTSARAIARHAAGRDLSLNLGRLNTWRTNYKMATISTMNRIQITTSSILPSIDIYIHTYLTNTTLRNYQH